MRIGIFTDSYTPYINGVSTSVMMLENALTKMGHDVFIVAVNPDDRTYKLERDGHVLRIPGFPIPIANYRLTTCYPIKAVNYIKEWNLDIIHSQTEFSIGTFARVIGKQFHIPVVHTYHTMYEDYIYYITKGYFDGTSKKVVEYITKFYCDKTIEELIVPTPKTYRLFKEKYKYDRNIHIIPTGIELDRFYKENQNENELRELRKSLGIKSKDKVILYLGRLALEKSVDFLIDNMVDILKKNPNTKLLIVGDGPDIETYKKLVNKHKINKNVIFTGFVEWTKVPLYYGISDIFTTASHTETQGLTVIEAMAADLPVVALDDESFRNVVIPTLNGYLFKDKKEYLKYMLDLLNDDKLRKSLSKQARINTQSYSSEYFASRILDVYKLALKDKKKNKSFRSRLKKTVKDGFYGSSMK